VGGIGAGEREPPSLGLCNVGDMSRLVSMQESVAATKRFSFLSQRFEDGEKIVECDVGREEEEEDEGEKTSGRG